MHLAFVLLPEAGPPDGEEIAAAFSDFAPPGQCLRIAESEGKTSDDREILSLVYETDQQAFVALMPIPVPDE